MTSPEIDAITRGLVPGIRSYTERALADALAPLRQRNADLEQRIIELETRPAVEGVVGPSGQKGESGAGISSLVVTAEGRLLAHLTDGRSVDAGPVPRGAPGDPGASVVGPQGDRGRDAPAADVEAIVTRVLAIMPTPAKGENGEPGRDIDVDALADLRADAAALKTSLDRLRSEWPDVDWVTDLVAAKVAAAVAALPAPKDGARGEQGERGLHGKDGADGLRGADGAAGVDGKDGAPGDRGMTGEKGLDGAPGRDGRDGTQGLQGMQGAKGLDGLHGKDGADGRDGVDGMGFDDAGVVRDERGWVFRLAQGERVKDQVIGFPFDVGVWKAGTTYEQGAGVTWDGHYWFAIEKTHEEPGENSTAWRMALRRGKQGREGRPGKDGAPSKDLTQMDSTGRKW